MPIIIQVMQKNAKHYVNYITILRYCKEKFTQNE